ncbi:MULTISPECIES: hypothetical protein [unclassified Streptomyces]|uniref:hypothetical protein n=1 Tax=unclassified Streptomyces TaxID=2593676 RepID=UPI002F9169A8
MDPLTFDDEDLHLRVDRGMSERFNLNSPVRTFRVPLRRLGALGHHKKPHKLGQLFVGIVRDPSSALYCTARFDFRFAGSEAVQVPLGDEPLFRACFSQVAVLAGRRVV